VALVTWQTDILNGINAPTSQNNINKMTAWSACEAPGLALYNNPFNTTLPMTGSYTVVVLNPSGGGVQKYPSMAVGIQATVNTLLHSSPSFGYSRIVNNLRNDGPQNVFAQAVGGTPWGTSGTCIANSVVPGATGGSTSGSTSDGSPANAQGPAGYTPAKGQVTFNYAQLEGIWIAAGGNKQTAAMAAAIAMAESGGNSQASNTNSNGSIDRGLWQINSSNGSGSTFDVMTNARTAVQMSNNGTNWRPWCTAYSDGACGTAGGCYQCSGAPYQKFLNNNTPPDTSVPLNGTAGATPPVTAPASGTTSTQQAQLTGWSDWLNCLTLQNPLDCLNLTQKANFNVFNPITWVEAGIAYMLNPLIQVVSGVMGIAAGAVIMLSGTYMIVMESRTGQQAKQAVGQATKLGTMAVAPEAAPEEAAAGAAESTWVTKTAPTKANPQGRTRMTRQVRYGVGAQGSPDPSRRVTRTTNQWLDDESGAYA
jgi:Lysozyme like domain